MDAIPVPPSLVLHSAFVRRLARALVSDESTADDLVQETWRAALEEPTQGELTRSWLGRVVRNFARRRWRAEAHRQEREHRAARSELQPGVASSLGRQELLERVGAALRELEEPYRSTVFARYYENLPPRLIARRDGIPVETVRTRIKRGLSRMRARLAQHEDDWRGNLAVLAFGPSASGASVAWATGAVLLLSTVGAVAWVAGAQHPGASGVAVDPPAALPAAIMEEGGSVSPPLARRAVTPAGATIEGRVTDQGGAPVADARVLVLAASDPFGDEGTEVGWNDLQGRGFRTGIDGRWSAVLPEPGRVRVVLEGSARLSAIEPADGEWIDAPAAGVDFVVQVHPVGSLAVRVLDGSRQPVESFRVVVRGDPDYRPEPGEPATYTGGFHSLRSEKGRVGLELRVDDPAGRRLLVVLGEPEVRGEALEQELRLLPGRSEEVVFVLPTRGRLAGFVVDAAGLPVSDALVFFGPETRVRGDEPFKPLRTERVLDGVRSDADGWFELRGEGPTVTAVHASLSPATVRAEEASRIVLGPLGSIRGRSLDARGLPRAHAIVLLDQESRETRTDVNGCFVFEEVEAGAHGLRGHDDEGWLGVRLAAGAEVEVELGGVPREPLVVRWMDAQGREIDVGGRREGAVVGRETVFSLRLLESGDAGECMIPGGLAPGSYWIFTRSGLASCFELAPGERILSLPVPATLSVRAERAGTIQVVPADADPFLRLIAARIRLRVGPDEPAVFHLAPGAYLLVGEAGQVLAELELPREGLELRLD